MKILNKIIENNIEEPEFNDIINHSDLEYKYMMLRRLQMDLDYYFGYGGRTEKHLWTGDFNKQIKLMKDLYNTLPEKPTWLSMEDIEKYEKQGEVNESVE